MLLLFSNRRDFPKEVFFFLVIYLTICKSGAIYEWQPPPDLCESTNKPTPPSTIGAAIPMPSLSPQYSMVIEANVLQEGWSYQLEEHFDGVNKRAAIIRTFNGTTARTIFNLDPLENYEIYADNSCVVTPGGKPTLEFLSIHRDKDFSQPPKSNFNVIFQSRYEQGNVYVGQAWVRGIKVDHWTSCKEWPTMSTKIQADYYFTRPNYHMAWNYGQTPVRIVLKGSTGNLNAPDVKNNHTFEQMYDFISVREGPPMDPGVFSIPDNVVCTGGSRTKTMPNLPDKFQMDFEILSPIIGNSLPIHQSLRYDWTNQLMEVVRDFPVPQGVPGDKKKHKPPSLLTKDSKGKDQSEISIVRRVVVVDDYHNGLQYITEKSNNTCHIRPLPSTSMSHGDALMRMSKDQTEGNAQFTYQGTSTFRGLPAESWGVEKDGMIQKVFYLVGQKGVDYPLTPEEKEEFKNGMTKLKVGLYPKFPVPIGIILRNRTTMDTRHLPTLLRELISDGVLKLYNDKFKLVADFESQSEAEIFRKQSVNWVRRLDMINDHIGEIDMNIYHFQPLHSEPEMFHVAQCYSQDQISKVILTIRTPYSVSIHSQPTDFSIAVQSSIAKAMGVSPIQISDVALTPVVNKEKKIDVTLVTFNLLGSPPVVEAKRTQMSIGDMKKRLFQAVHDGITFSVKYSARTKSYFVDTNDYAVDCSLEEFSIVQLAALTNHASNPIITRHESDKEGYSGSVVAGVAIATMVATCLITALIVVSFLKIRKRPEFPSIPYHASKE